MSWAFWTGVAVLLWVWLLYPLTIALLARLRPHRSTSTGPSATRSFSVIIAAHNEADTIAARIADIRSQDYPVERVEVIVASDGSSDGTDAVVQRLTADDTGVRLVSQSPQAGRAAAHNLAVEQATGELLLFTDAETRFEPGFLRAIAAAFDDREVGLASGRLDFAAPAGGVAAQVGLYWRLETRLIEAESRAGVTLFGSGACLAVRRDLYRPIPPSGDVDTVLALDVVAAGLRCRWVPDARARDTLPAAPADEMRARVRMTAKGLHASFTRWPPGDYLRRPVALGVLLSHKVGRWVGTPLALLLLAPSSAWLAPQGGVYGFAAVAQLLGYGLALADAFGLRLPLGNAARGFVLANIAFARGSWLAVTGQVSGRYRPTRQAAVPASGRHGPTSAPSLQRVIGWDVVTWQQALALFDAHLPASLTDRQALEIGSREGGLSLWLAARGASVLGSDLQGPAAVLMQDATALGLAARITPVSADATCLPWRARFDVVIAKSVLGGVARDGRRDRQALAVAEMAATLRPGGLLLLAENLAASPLHRLARRLFVPWGRRWRYTGADELLGDVRAAGLEVLEERRFGLSAAFGRSEGQRRALARVDAVLQPLLPVSWRYVMALVARRPG